MAKVHTINIQNEEWEIQDLPLTHTVNEILNAMIPIGAILPYYLPTPPTSGNYALCHGQTLNTSEYPEYARLKNITSSTFTLPDLRESVLVGAGQNTTNTTIANHDTYTIGQFKDDQLQTHTHRVLVHTITSGSSESQGGQGQGYKETTGVYSGRTGTTTHGKQTGVEYIIRLK